VKANKSARLTAVVLGAIGAVVLMASRAVAVEAAYPVERVQQSIVRRVCSRISGMFRGAAAEAENVRLRREVAALSLLREDAVRLEQENARLRKALGYVTAQPGRWIAAGVLSREGGAAGVAQTVRVDKGSLAGVREGAVVTVPEGLVGRVSLVTPHTAEVLLIGDRSCKVACVVEGTGTHKVRGILCGGDDDSLLLRHLTDVSEVPARSQVLTSGLGGVFPRGIAVGTLLDVRKDADGLASEGEVLPAVDFSTLEDVFIRCD